MVVQYLGQEVLKRQIQGSDIRIMYRPSSIIPPTPAVLEGRFPCVPLPEPPSALPAGEELQALFNLLPFMERGVVLTSTPQGVYGKRFCQGRVFWTGPHTTMLGLHKMERKTEPVLLFSKDAFKQRECAQPGTRRDSSLRTRYPSCTFSSVSVSDLSPAEANSLSRPLPLELDHFVSHGGEPPRCSITLCFGEELSNTEDPSGKLIIVQVTLLYLFLTCLYIFICNHFLRRKLHLNTFYFL